MKAKVIQFSGLVKRELRQGDRFVLFFNSQRLESTVDMITWDVVKGDDIVSDIKEGLKYVNVEDFEKITIEI